MTFSLQDICDLSDLPICIRTWCIRHFAKREESYHPHAPSKNRPRYCKYTHKISWLSFCFFLTGACWPRWLVVSGKDLFPHFLFLLLLWHHHQEQNGASWRFCSNDCWLDSKKRKRKKESHFLDFPVYSCSKFKFRLNRCLKSNRHLKSKQNRYGLAPFQTYLFQWMKWRIIPRLGQHNQRNGELSGCWALATAVYYI